jgi:hypothetical protein
MKTRLLKIGVASLAYVPMAVLLFGREFSASIPQAVVTGCSIFNFPALSLLRLVQAYHVSKTIDALSCIVFLLLWSSLIAWFLWRAVGTFQGDDEPDDRHGQFDWTAFQLRFVVGFVIGSLVGWRFVRYTTSMRTLLTASIVTGCIGGFIFGISRPPDFWSRP